MEATSTSSRRKSSASTPSTTILSPAASPSPASTHTSAGSPPANAPTPKAAASTAPPRVAIRPNAAVKAAPLGQKPMASGFMNAPTSNEARPLSMTSKEWVIPPRPKPGRKPATDTPPTRRKAQNRAAQRAFRERRAARVGELEEQLDEQKDEHDRLVRELQERISHLEIETENLQTKCQWLEGQLEQERMSKGTTGRNWEEGSSMRNSSIHSFDDQRSLQHTGAPSLPVSSPTEATRPGVQPFSISQIISPPDELGGSINLGCGSCSPDGHCACAEEVLASASLNMGCGNCGIGTRCKCLEESLEGGALASGSRRRPGSPTLGPGEDKRPRLDITSPMETDFTAIFSSNRNASVSRNIQPPQPPTISSVEPRDSCGFCKDGTYCVCAEALVNSTVLPLPTRQTTSGQTRTPPPSEHDVVPAPMEVTATGAIKLPRLPSMRSRSANTQRPQQAPSSGCGPNGPGTCAQCLADPKSGLFCRSLAANFERNSRGQGPPGGCCGQGGPGGCCKTANANAPPKVPGLSLSCAETYKTLASHRNFDEAADEIGTWLPKLKAVPTPEAQGSQPPIRLAPIEVEAASIMSVLKEFDVRFGRGE